MFDIVNFKPAQKEYEGILLHEANSLMRDVFVSTADVAKARSIVKKARYLHFQNYEFEQGLIKLMKENDCALVVGLSDFFGVDEFQAASRMRRASNLIKVALKYGVKVRIFTLARDEMQLRDEYEIFYIGKLLGIDDGRLKAMREEEL